MKTTKVSFYFNTWNYQLRRLYVDRNNVLRHQYPMFSVLQIPKQVHGLCYPHFCFGSCLRDPLILHRMDRTYPAVLGLSFCLLKSLFLCRNFFSSLLRLRWSTNVSIFNKENFLNFKNSIESFQTERCFL